MASYEAFDNDEQLLEVALNCMLYGMLTKEYGHEIGDYSDVAESFGTSKSTVGQRFIKANA